MRDRRFVAAHRGGPLDKASHIALARWAAECAERVLPLFTRSSEDERVAAALKTARAWAAGEVKTGVAMKAAVAAHAAAREVRDAAARAAARAAGHAVATAHAADHSMGALLYAMKSMEACGQAAHAERAEQLAKLPPKLRAMVAEGVDLRWRKLRGKTRPKG
jgi:hypothetical protein